MQQARNLVMDPGERMAGLRFVIHDRDPLFTSAFREIFTPEGLRVITTLPLDIRTRSATGLAP